MERAVRPSERKTASPADADAAVVVAAGDGAGAAAGEGEIDELDGGAVEVQEAVGEIAVDDGDAGALACDGEVLEQVEVAGGRRIFISSRE